MKKTTYCASCRKRMGPQHRNIYQIVNGGSLHDKRFCSDPCVRAYMQKNLAGYVQDGEHSVHPDSPEEPILHTIMVKNPGGLSLYDDSVRDITPAAPIKA
jgi:hypothetical protein